MSPLSLLKSVLVALVLCSSISSFAAGSDGTRGGGDEVGIEARRLLNDAVREVGQKNDLRTLVDLSSLEKTARSTKLVIVDQALYVTAGLVKQNSVAVNERATLTVQINRARWKGISDDRIKKATLLHEVLSLAGFEETGGYSISSRYLAATGVTCSQDLCNQPPVPFAGFDFVSATRAYHRGEVPTFESLKGKWTKIGVAPSPVLFKGYFGLREQFDPKGLTNKDGSLSQLDFAQVENVFGETSTTVTILGLGSQQANQGPFAFQILDSGACFAQYSYVDNKLDPKSGFNYQCRLVNSSKLLLCSFGPFGMTEAMSQPMNSLVIAFDLFLR